MDFYQKVALVLNRIPYGRVATYGQIALLCGKPKNARQVGYALNKKTGKGTPAHRVVNSRGFLSGAAAFSMPGEQELLLKAEGVPVDENHCVDLKKYGWRHTYEDAVELRKEFKRSGEES